MKNKKMLINFISIPKFWKKINEAEIKQLEELLCAFRFSVGNNYYNFVYADIEIIITNGGTVSISLVSTSDLSQNLTHLSNLVDKINSIISVKCPLIKNRIQSLNN